ncbi:acyl-CoA dehydrogenase family protein [Leucobacter sp. UCMA 4100]|uniref:acyl-CoA dehydrogenase family protein n=1 Tax=Leucobacter sp. UCMA 4100 TaxID=2810534 RepID=UPI0022EA6973|nr:acyl-CoA dehydrogenase family protein [Leucobacter sp. UCMA 4100]
MDLMDVTRSIFTLTDEQEAIVELCDTFAKEKIRPIAKSVDEADSGSPVDLFQEAAKVGITDFMIPEQFGGGGYTDLFTQCLVQERLCWGDLGIGNFLCSNGFFADPLLVLGTDEQKEEWLRPLTGDNPLYTALATTEPGAGSDAASMTMTATRTEGGYLLKGQKVWISNAGIADQYVVFAKTDSSQRSRGVSAFLMHSDAEGFSYGEPMKKMGQRAIQCRELFFDDVFIPEANRLGEEGQGFLGLMKTFDASRIVLAAAATGIARAALEYATNYARERETFGKPIIENQAVSFRLADMATRINAAWLQTLQAATMFDQGKPVGEVAAMAKLQASETAAFCTWAAVQTLGGWGYSREFPVEQWMRDAKLEEIEEGTSDIMRLIISRNL